MLMYSVQYTEERVLCYSIKQLERQIFLYN